VFTLPIDLTRLGLLALGWSMLLGIVLPDAPRELRAQELPAISTPADARARWEALSVDEQARLRKRFERLQQLDEGERTELARRAKRWKAEEERVLRRLSQRDKLRLMQHPPQKRKQLIEEMVRSERRDEGHRIEAKLPRKTREWLVDAPPEQRRKRLEQFKNDTRERISARAVRELIAALGMGEKEIQRLEQLPIDERMSHVLRLRKQLTAQQLEADGLPSGFMPEQWEALGALPPEEYFHEILRLRHEGELRDLPPIGEAERRDPRPTRELARDLRRGLHVRPEELLELAHLGDEERSAEIDRRRRTRLLMVLRRHAALSETQIDALAHLGDRELFTRVRAFANGWSEEAAPPEPVQSPPISPAVRDQ
jgi:hypothetical protein